MANQVNQPPVYMHAAEQRLVAVQTQVDQRLLALREEYSPKIQVLEREKSSHSLMVIALLISSAVLATFGHPNFAAIGLLIFIVSFVATWIKLPPFALTETVEMAGNKEVSEALATPGFFEYGLEEPVRLSSALRIKESFALFRAAQRPALVVQQEH